MKIALDEKLKHRLIGLAVIISLGAIFAPTLMKKSSQHLEDNYHVNVQLPSKPLAPNVVMTDEKEIFKSIKIAKIDIQDPSEEKRLKEKGTVLVKAEPISINAALLNQDSQNNKEQPTVESMRLVVNNAANNMVKKTIKIADLEPLKHARAPVIALKQNSSKTDGAKKHAIAKPTKLARVLPVKNKAAININSSVQKDVYAVQLASFSQLNNAQALINRLHSQGYKASFIKTSSKTGAIYKVYVGHSPRKVDVEKLKGHLANAMQLNGFVVNTRLS